MVDIVFPTSSAPGERPQESGGRLINAFAVAAPKGAPSDIIWRRSPGLLRKGTAASHTHTRGFLNCGAVCLWVLEDRVYSVDSDFVVTNIGALSGALPVTLARNNASPTPHNLAVTGSGCFNLFTGSAPTAFADADLPGSPTSVEFFEGYFLWTFGDGRIFASNLNSVSVASNSFTTEQGLVARRGLSYAGRFYVFGDKWTGVYRNAATSPFPLAREVTIPRGIIGTHAVAGTELGWRNEPIFVGDDFIVYSLSGYSITPISTDDVSRDIQEAVAAGEADLLEASVYMYGGNAFWTLTWPGHWTWEYNLATKEWNERSSYGRSDWRGRKSIRMFDRWLVGDDATGHLFEVSGSYFLEDVDALIWRVISGVSHAFPRGILISRASFHMTAGVGEIALQADPKVLISWSLDGGHSYGNPVVRRLGGPGETRFYPSVLSCGLSRGQGVRYQLVVSDPVHVALMGGAIEAEDRGP